MSRRHIILDKAIKTNLNSPCVLSLGFKIRFQIVKTGKRKGEKLKQLSPINHKLRKV